MQKTAGSNLSSASRGTRLRKRFASWQLYVMVIPALLYILLFHYKPMYGIIIAFKDFSMRPGIQMCIRDRHQHAAGASARGAPGVRAARRADT